jgi:hypothetical protein
MGGPFGVVSGAEYSAHGGSGGGQGLALAF